MKVLVISDVHGSHNWEKIKYIPKDKYDYAVFLGDYFDSYSWNNKNKRFNDTNKWPDQIENVVNIINWVREDTEHRKLLIGNHDFSYISCGRDSENVSGHQWLHKYEIRSLILGNYNVFDLAFECDGWVFSHAGFTYTWRSYLIKEFHSMFDKIDGNSKPDDIKYIPWDEHNWGIQFLNDTFHNLSHFHGDPNANPNFDELLDWHGCFSSTGEEKMQGCLWIRPHSLLDDALFPNQVVGHTALCVDEPVLLQNNRNKIMIVDSLDHDLINIFDTENPGDFMYEINYERFQKKLKKTINNIRSMKLTNPDVIKSKLIEVGIKENSVSKYLDFMDRGLI